jgi:hypothetical protein
MRAITRKPRVVPNSQSVVSQIEREMPTANRASAPTLATTAQYLSAGRLSPQNTRGGSNDESTCAGSGRANTSTFGDVGVAGVVAERPERC